ncbi:helix-turn-helix domain-containing protein [Marisediminicola senii]|uniref:helix-turn-helix domain-containing protein n=1 Tax=Marisediminicola senii TaxID=2711233 RepID=UPI0019133D6C|nr:helix-turn-helix transcriptional regulator [Marisediminicola senii]
MLDQVRGFTSVVRVPRSRAAAPAVVLAVCLVAVVALAFHWMDGLRTFVTHPVATLALAGSATGIAMLGARRGALGDRAGSRWLFGLAVGVAAYLGLGALATTLTQGGSPVTPAVVGLWNAWWAVPLATVQLAALRTMPRTRGWSIAFGALAGLSVLFAAVLAEPVDPFAGVPPAAPEGWSSPPVAGALVTLYFLATVTTPVLLAVRLAHADRARRVAGLLAVAAAAIPPLLVVVCVGLAVARDPGNVSASIGSVGYLVSIAVGCLAASIALSLVRPTADGPAMRRIVGGILGGYAAVGVVLSATWLGAMLVPAGPLVSGLVVAAITLSVGTGWWLAVSAILGWLATHEKPDPAVRLALLSPREREVMALLADGVRDAEIAARLHLSERTVESHLTRIFAKLGLDTGDGRNRRVLAVRAWTEAGAGS